MGWLEGVLTGYADRHYEIQKEKMRAAELAAEREGKVFDTLLNSKYKDIQDYAMAGILDLSNPRRRKGGVAGWMGDVEQTPYLDMIRRTREKFDADPELAQANLREDYYSSPAQRELGGTPPTTPSVPSAAGSVPGQASAAQVSTSPVTGGPVTPATPAPQSAPPPTPPAPVGAAGGPQAGAPPQMSAPGSVGAPGQAGAAGAPPAPPAGPPLSVSGPPPPPPGQVGGGLPGATTQSVGAMQPVRPSRTQLPGIFPTASELAMDAARARSAGTDLGEQDSYIRVAEAQGLTRAEGLQMWAEAQMKSRSGGAGAASPYAWRTMEYVDVQGNKRRILARTNRVSGKVEDINGNPLPANATPVTPGLYPYEVAQRRLAQNPLLWNQALTQARSVLGLNATAEEVIDFADQLFTQSQTMAPSAPAVSPGAAPPGGVVPGAAGPVVAPNAADPAAAAAAAGAAAAADPNAASPVAPPQGAGIPPMEPVPSHAPTTPGAALKEGLQAAGAGDSLTRRRDEGRPATTQERDMFGFYLRARQTLDAILAPDKTTGQTLEDRIARAPLGSQFGRTLIPDKLDFLLGNDAQLYKTASERFTEARVRRVSGATVRPDEYEQDRKMFFAQPGDSKERIAEKQRLREAEMDANVFAAGPAYNEYFKKPYTPSYMQQDPNATRRLPPPMPGPPVNRAVPRIPGMPAPVPSHTPTTPQSTAPPATPQGTPTSVQGPDGKWYIVWK